MANPKYVLIIDEGINEILAKKAEACNSGANFNSKYNIKLLSRIRNNGLYYAEFVDFFFKNNNPEVVLFELLGEYNRISPKIKENGRTVGMISKSEYYDNACKSLYGNDMKFVRLNGNPEETSKNLDALFE